MSRRKWPALRSEPTLDCILLCMPCTACILVYLLTATVLCEFVKSHVLWGILRTNLIIMFNYFKMCSHLDSSLHLPPISLVRLSYPHLMTPQPLQPWHPHYEDLLCLFMIIWCGCKESDNPRGEEEERAEPKCPLALSLRCHMLLLVLIRIHQILS